jgi:hypothetical protein
MAPTGERNDAVKPFFGRLEIDKQAAKDGDLLKSSRGFAT